MSLFKAQIAFLIQISLVLSVTDTIIIFITPIPQIKSDIEPIKSRKVVIIPVVCLIFSTNFAKLVNSKPAAEASFTLNFLIKR